MHIKAFVLKWPLSESVSFFPYIYELHDSYLNLILTVLRLNRSIISPLFFGSIFSSRYKIYEECGGNVGWCGNSVLFYILCPLYNSFGLIQVSCSFFIKMKLHILFWNIEIAALLYKILIFLKSSFFLLMMSQMTSKSHVVTIQSRGHCKITWYYM